MKSMMVITILLTSGVFAQSEWGEINYEKSTFQESSKAMGVAKKIQCKYFSTHKNPFEKLKMLDDFQDHGEKKKLDLIVKTVKMYQSSYCQGKENINPSLMPSKVQGDCSMGCQREFSGDKALSCESLCESYVSKFSEFSNAVIEAKNLSEKAKSPDCTSAVSNTERSVKISKAPNY